MKDTFVLTDMSIKLYKCFKYEKNSSKIEASDDVVILDLPFFPKIWFLKICSQLSQSFPKEKYNPWK